jgi:solute carrier family 13 (sodium-dependent dicarboxylate transporter), member 2/3/5
VLLLIAYVVIRFVFIRSNQAAVSRNYFKERYKALGKMNYEEKAVGTLFILTALLWFTRSDLEIGSFFMPGWGSTFGVSEYVQDGTVAILVAVLLFIIPSLSEPGRALITWKEATRIPYEIILLFGGGFAMAKGFELSGLSKWLASHIHFATGNSMFVFVLLLGFFIVLISEFSSNVACIQLMLPVLISLQPVMNVHPLMLLFPATLAASLGFMLPVATAPNTIVFGSGKITMKEMMKTGVYLDIAGILLIALLSLFL